jgi:SAM-dependent methyltransferase
MSNELQRFSTRSASTAILSHTVRNATAEIMTSLALHHDCSAAEDEVTSNKLARLLDDARKFGCHTALVQNGHNVEYLTDPSRAKYIDISGIRLEDDVLEIGSSMGQHTRLIAARCRTLKALEVVKEQAEFSRVWCDEEGLKNVEIVAGGAGGKLPYRDRSFDLVIMNYVLEWCAGRAKCEPSTFHLKYLQEVYRVLKPTGRLFLSTKNRFAFKYLTGVVDEHLGIRFGSALPRRLQRWLCKGYLLDHPPGYLHSWTELRSLLDRAGFVSVQELFCFPDARFPIYLGPASGFDPSVLPPETVGKLGLRDKAALRMPSVLRNRLSASLVYLAQA